MSGILGWLERAGRLLRAAGLGRVVDAVGPAVGGAAARREVEVDGFRLTGSHVGQLYYLRELAEGRDAFLAELLREAARPRGTAVEGGAHIGYLTLHLAAAVGAGGRVLAFEPDPGVQGALRGNLARNGLGARVVVAQQALGERAGRAVLHVSGGGETSSLFGGGDAAREHVEVEVVALDDVLPADATVDVVKLDVEGAELSALRGMARVLERSSAVLFLECNPGALAAAGASAEELLAWLRGAGFDVWRIDERARRLSRELGVGEGEYVNLACARAEAAERLARRGARS